MSRYPAYPEYKPTGCDWFPEIPSHWKFDRAKWSVISCQNGVWGAEAEGDDDLVCIRVADFDRQSLRVSTEKLTLRSIAEKDRRNRLLEAGNLLLEKSGGGENQLVGAVVEFNQPFPAVSSNFIARMVASDDMNSRFLVYLHSHLYSGRVNFRSIKQTTGIQNLDSQAYLDEPITYPPLAEQNDIARFLDFKTAQIDALIAKKKALLDKLAEKRTALINHAVTKGLDPSVTMKDSGVAWLGDIPAHWQRMLMVRVISKFEQGWSPSCDEREASLDEWGVLKSGCVNYGVFQEQEHKTLPPSIDPIPSLEVKAGDILMCRASGSKHLIGSVAMVRKCRSKLIFSDKTYRITLQPNIIDSEFFVLLMKSKYLRDQIELSISGADGLANNIPQSSVKGYQIVLPSSVGEQKEISTFLNKKSESIETQEVKIFEAIGRLQEYRAALITNSVTGKIDVRGFEIPQPAEGITS
jgi:type I restriction enzyme, S subunit